MNENRLQISAVFGFILVALGALLLAGQFLTIDFGPNLWPFAIIGGGALFFVVMFISGPDAGGLAIPGSMITMTGLVLLVQNTFNRYETWAYCWALVMMAMGAGVVIRSYWSHLDSVRAWGLNTIRLGLVLFLFTGAFFEGFVFRHSLLTGMVWPLVLILVGGYLLVSRFFTKPMTHNR